MCHTRELAFQISKEYERFSKYMPTIKVIQTRQRLIDELSYIIIFCYISIGWSIFRRSPYHKGPEHTEEQLPTHSCWYTWPFVGTDKK